ncbi:MAG: hypothetical protein SFW67_14885 [Myxococcaceae bacterium]|nr:hypothetical protein [Myxococcaceae bacterium]
MRAPRRHSISWTVIVFISCATPLGQGSCPAPAGGPCEPRKQNCPDGYYCPLAEVCTRTCEQTSDCWVPVEKGCRSDGVPFMRLPDGGTFTETQDDGFCPETRRMVCLGGFCQKDTCPLEDGGCDYDVYGPSPFKGNRSVGPAE